MTSTVLSNSKTARVLVDDDPFIKIDYNGFTNDYIVIADQGGGFNKSTVLTFEQMSDLRNALSRMLDGPHVINQR